MPRNVKIYATTVIGLGALTLASAGLLWECASVDRFLICLFLSLLGATFKVGMPGSDTCISPSFVPFFFALGTMSWQETVLMAACAGVLQSLWHAKQQSPLLQTLFNGANLALAVGVAYAVSHAVAAAGSVALLLVAAAVFQVVNTVIVAGVLSLVQGDSLKKIWRNCHFWSFPFHLAGAALAAVWVQNDHATTIGFALMICAGVLYLMSTFYAELVKRLSSTKNA